MRSQAERAFARNLSSDHPVASPRASSHSFSNFEQAKTSSQATYLLTLMMPARNLCFTYAKEEPKRAGDMLAGPRDLRSARAAGRRAALLPSLRRSSPQASHAQGTAALSMPSDRGPNLSGRAEGNSCSPKVNNSGVPYTLAPC